MIALGTIASAALSFFTGGKTKIITILVVALVAVIAIGGMCLYIKSLKVEIAEVKEAKAAVQGSLDKTEAKLKNRQTEINLLEASSNQTELVIQGLQGQIERLKKSTQWLKQQRAEARKLTEQATTVPVNATEVLSNEDSSKAVVFINNSLGLHSPH